MYQIAFKSGTQGYEGCDGEDKLLKEVPSDNIPRIGETIVFGGEYNTDRKSYLVTDVKRSLYVSEDGTVMKEYIRVYVVRN